MVIFPECDIRHFCTPALGLYPNPELEDPGTAAEPTLTDKEKELFCNKSDTNNFTQIALFFL